MRLLRPLVVAALTIGGVLASTNHVRANFLISIGGATSGSGFVQSTSQGQTISANLNNLTVSVHGAIESGSTFNLDQITITNTNSAGGASVTENIIVRSNDISYLSGALGTLTATAPYTTGVGSGTTINSQSVDTGNSTGLITGTQLASISGDNGTAQFTTSGSDPRYIERVYNVTVAANSSIVLLNNILPQDTFIAGVTTFTPAPATGLLALAGLPLLGLARALRRRKTEVAVA